MSRKPITLRPDADVAEAIKLFLNHPVSCIPIVDGEFQPVGIVSWRDILKVCAGLPGSPDLAESEAEAEARG
jgi:acetoin utilization protein AcuB